MLGKLVASGCLEFTHLTNPAIMQAFDITPDGKQIVFESSLIGFGKTLTSFIIDRAATGTRQ